MVSCFQINGGYHLLFTKVVRRMLAQWLNILDRHTGLILEPNISRLMILLIFWIYMSTEKNKEATEDKHGKQIESENTKKESNKPNETRNNPRNSATSNLKKRYVNRMIVNVIF